MGCFFEVMLRGMLVMKLHNYVTCSKNSISPGTSSLFDLQSDDYFLPTKRSVDEKRNVNVTFGDLFEKSCFFKIFYFEY